jgi:prepilin-type N-terminal cleavage/methylation domain-containing protein
MLQKVKGFTLVELMVVVAIMGILAGIGSLAIVNTLPSYNLTRAARDMVSSLRKARSMAIKYNRDVLIEFNVDKDSYTIDRLGINKHVSIPETYSGIKLGFPGRSKKVSFTDNKLTFNTTGLTGGARGYAYLQNRKGSGYRIGITSLAANIVLEKCGSKDSNGATITCLE